MTDVQVIETDIATQVVQSYTVEREVRTEGLPISPDDPELVTRVLPLIRGAKGDTGEPGAPGADGRDGIDATASYRHVQGSPSAVWHIVHNLHFKPAGLHVTDSAGTTVEGGDIEHLSVDDMTVTYTAAFAGEADVS